MNRRAFFRLVGAGAAGLVLDPERLLWVPGAKTIFLPSPTIYTGHTAGNTFVAADWLAHEALRVLERELTFMQTINHTYADAFDRRRT